MTQIWEILYRSELLASYPEKLQILFTRITQLIRLNPLHVDDWPKNLTLVQDSKTKRSKKLITFLATMVQSLLDFNKSDFISITALFSGNNSMRCHLERMASNIRRFCSKINLFYQHKQLSYEHILTLVSIFCSTNIFNLTLVVARRN